MGYRVERDVEVTMGDGVRLSTDVWIPDGGPAPTLVWRTPYGKGDVNVMTVTLNPNVLALVDAGYAVVRQDCRGTFASEGTFTPMAHEADDGADTLAWVQQQPWCDGNIGTFGLSYMGFTQWASASRAPEALQAMVPGITTPDFYLLWHSEGGVPAWHSTLFWCTFMGMADAQRALVAGSGDVDVLMRLVDVIGGLEQRLQAAPSDQEALATHVPYWSEWLKRPDRDAFWQQLSFAESLEAPAVPALYIGGWFDLFAGDTARTFTRRRSHARSSDEHEGQRLIIGPWDHLDHFGTYHDRQFGLAASVLSVDLTGEYLRFYDRWLRGHLDPAASTTPVRIFVMGIDEWRDELDWPLPDTTYVDFHLDSAGHANTAGGDGVLSWDAPVVESSDTFVFDPADPVPSLGGRIMLPSSLNAVGPVDQRPVEGREDVLCFTSAVLLDAVEVTGHVSLVLHVASSALDTDFAGKLVDVFPDGRAIYLTDGILRARYRESLAAPELLEPDRVYELTVDLAVTSNVFLPGHRIRLEVSSSCFPRFGRNTNTGGVIAEEYLEQAVVATNRVLHGPRYPSRLVLPVIPRRG